MARNWWYYWAALALLGLAAIVIPIVYNLGLQLTPAQLETARQRWAREGSRQYQLLQLIRHDDDAQGEELLLWVEDGKVKQVVQNSQPLRFHEAMAVVVGGIVERAEVLDFSSHSVEGLFDAIDRQLQADAQTNATARRNYSTATFDQRDGHPIRYVHRVSGTRQRQEWLIKMIQQAGK